MLLLASSSTTGIGSSLQVAGQVDGYVYDAVTGADLAVYDFANAPTFINDVVVTRTDAWFTDSMKAVS